MSDRNVLEVKGVSQRFSRSMRHALRYGVYDIFRQCIPSYSGKPRKLMDGEFWALHDVSFSLKAGESLGVLGNNGAGKSTLLKLIAGIYRPTAGHIRVAGRIGAIIELGSAFAPNLSGRENIRLQALLHGYTPGLLRRKMDDILAFADLGEFIDSPVQYYSTGMRARLGFAVAVHGNPDLLLVDEVLAVGDLSFKNKCLRLVETFRERGGAVVFVGHSTHQMQAACERGIILERGRIQFEGSIVHAIDMVLQNAERSQPSEGSVINKGYFPTQGIRNSIDSNDRSHFEVLSSNIAYQMPSPGSRSGSAAVDFTLNVHQGPVRLNGLAAFFSHQGTKAIAISITDAVDLSSGMQKLTMDIPSLPLLPGNYHVKISLIDESASFSLWNRGWSDPPLEIIVPGQASFHGNIAKSVSSKILLTSQIHSESLDTRTGQRRIISV